VDSDNIIEELIYRSCLVLDDKNFKGTWTFATVAFATASRRTARKSVKT